MRKSDIFEDFIKIAQEKFKPAAEHTEKDFHETNPRMDSLSIEQISKLYNIKTPTPKDMEYKKNIMEVAHPNPAIIYPAFDRLNALVENENERQTINLNMIFQENTGQNTQRKYAKKDLILSLVRIGNKLDNTNNNNLIKLADHSLSQITQRTKTAIAPLIYLVGAAISALYAKQHLQFHSDGWTQDYQKAIKEIDDLLNSNTNLGVGYSYTQNFLNTVNQLKTLLDHLNNDIEHLTPILNELDSSLNSKEFIELAKDQKTQQIHQEVLSFTEKLEKLYYPYFNKILSDFSNPSFKQRAISQKGFLSSIIDSTEVLHGGHGLFSDDFDDVVHALETLKTDIENIVKSLQGAEKAKQEFIQLAQQSQSEVSQMNEKEVPKSTPDNKENNQEDEIDSFLKGT